MTRAMIDMTEQGLCFGERSAIRLSHNILIVMKFGIKVRLTVLGIKQELPMVPTHGTIFFHLISNVRAVYRVIWP